MSWNEKQKPQRFGRYAAILIMLLTLGVGQMWAGPTFSGGYAYFYNKGGWTDSYKWLFIGRDKWEDDWTEIRTMTAISNTKLWYNALPTSGWGDATYMGVAGNGSSWSSGKWGSSNLSNANHRTGAVSLGDWGFGSGNVNMLTPANGNNDATLTLSYVGSGYSSLNNTITIKAKVSTNNGSSYSETTTPAALTGGSKVFTSYTSCAGTTGASATLSVGSSSTTFKAGYTATTTLTAPSTDPTGYKFDGWYNSSGTRETTSKTLTIYPTGDATYYAYYRKLYTFSAGSTIVWDLCGNEKSWSAVYLYKDIEGGSTSNDAFTQCGSTTQYKKTYADAVSNIKVWLFRAQNGSTWSDYMQTTDIYRDASGVTLYEFAPVSYTGTKLDWQVTTGAKKATSGTKVYFDNTNANWEEIWIKYGTTRFNRHTGARATKVTGTDNLYVITMPEAYYVKWYFADAYGYTNRNSIETMTSINNRIGYQTTDLTSDITYIPSTSSGTPKVWNTTTLSGHTRRLTFGSHTNGNITVRYTDESGTEQTVSSSSASYVDVAQTCKVIITAVPNSGYAPSGLTLGGGAITSGAQQIIRADGTIVATFVAEETHDVTVSYKIGSRTLHADQTFEVGVTTASNISSEEIDGFSFSSWSNLSSDIVNNTGDLTTDPININTTVDGGDCSMTCNYTQWPCSLDIVASEGAVGYSSRSAMSYDATTKAYYKEITTGSATERYRFYINSIEYSPSTNTEMVIAGTKITANTDVTGYASNKPSAYFNDGGTGSKIKVWFDYENGKAWVEEVKYTVTVNAGSHGEVDPTSVSVGNVVASGTISATADDHYHFSSWTIPSGVTVVSGSGTKDITIKTTGTKEITANFAGDQYTITYKDQGNVAFTGSQTDPPTIHTYGTATTLKIPTKNGYTFGGWFTASDCASGAVGNTSAASLSATGYTANITLYAKWTENMTTVNLVASPAGKGTFTVGSTPNQTSTTAGVTTHPTVTAVPATGYRINTSSTVWTKSNSYINLSATNAASTTITGTGTTGNSTNLTATFTPITYTIAFNANGGSGTMTNQASVAYDSETTIKANTFTRTGYNFAGWAESAGGAVVRADGAAHGNLSSTDGATVTLYAKWTPKQSALTLNYQTSADGYASSGSISNTSGLKGTYGSAMTALTGTMPTADPGYAFMGFYDATGGSGTKYYNADGSSAHNWDKNTESGTTLYAYYEKAEITELTHNASVAKADVAYLVVNPVLNVTPTDYTDICWTLHYKENDNEVATSGSSYYAVAPYTESGTKPNQVRFTLNNLAVGSYYVKAVLKAKATAFSSVCSEGTELDTETGDFSIVGSSTVTIQFKDYTTGDVIASSGSVEIEAESSAGVKAPNIIGYSFNSWSLGAGVTNTCADGASCGTGKDSINISSPFDGVITAFYTKKRVIYFNNTLNWNGVTVYFYSGGYWNDDNGTGSASGGTYQKCGEMTQIEGTNIWYYDAEAASVSSSYTHVAFTEVKQEGYTHFSYEEGSTPNKVIYRSDYKSTTLPMFVPIEQEGVSKNSDQAMYYNEGYWMNYPDNTGYTLKIYNGTSIGSAFVKEKEFTFNANKKLPLSVIVDLEKGQTYGFKIYRADGGWYGNANTMSNGHSGDEGQTVWEFTTGTNNCGLTPTSAGDYTFTLNYGLDASSAYNYLVGVRYPESTGDYRVLYKDNTHTKWLASKVIPKNSEKDTISYFVRSAGSPQMKLQKCTATWNGSSTSVSWSDTVTNLISSLPSVISSNGDGVYYFCLNKNEETGKRELGDTKLYEGNFYIRVKGAGSTGWDSYRTADHIMPYSEYSFNQTIDPYSHYFTHFYRTKTDGGADLDPIDISFVVANDYSTNISDTIAQDGIGDNYVDESGNLSGRNANIRFMYNYKTNTATRRYLDGAQGPGSDDFLLLIPSNNTSIYNAQTEGSAYTQVKFGDNGNWIYEANVYVEPGTTYKLKSQFGTGGSVITQYLKGKESGEGQYETLISGSGSRLKIRLLYDFKTNRVIAAYKPSGTIDANLTLNADIMFERVHQGNVTQITFGENKSISAIQNVYTTLKFEKEEINNLYLSRYERDLFYVSFPYNVRVSDIIGFGEYGKHWIIEYYDGAARAEKGFWSDSKSFWKFVTPAMASSFTLQAGTGYIVALDLDEMESTDPVWENTSTVELIFPGDITSISNQEVTYTMPSHQCNIGPRFEGGDDRRIKDSHWNVLGVPAYHNTTGSFANHTDEIGNISQVWSAEGKPNYLYTWNMTDNSLSVTNASGYNYKAMHAYVVQYYGDVTFHTSTNAAPASVAARRNENAPRDVEFRLEIQQNETTVDQTFVKLSNEEGISTEFVFGEDLSKEFNKNKANIYTMVTSTIEGDASITQVAGNTLPMSEQTTVVPVGVQIKADGEYTFAMPEGTEGIGVVLVDNVANTRTNLGLTDYTVTLSQGTIDGRFMLEISPVQQTPTDIEEVTGYGLPVTGARKVMIDGILYIVKDGKMFDARGAMVK